jgi:hypothetical protein
VIHCAEEKTGVDIYLGVGGAPKSLQRRCAESAARCKRGS